MEIQRNDVSFDHTSDQPAQPSETTTPAPRPSGLAEYLTRDEREETVSREDQQRTGARPLEARAPKTVAAKKDGPSWLNVRVPAYSPGNSSARKTAKLDPTAPEFETYMADMARNIGGKAAFFKSEIERLGPEKKVVLDFGTCGGELVETLSDELPQHQYAGLDLSRQMLASGRQRMVDRGMERVPGLFAADGFRPPLKSGSIDVVTMSSFFHELFSYSNQPHTVEGLKPAMQEVHRILNEDGRVIIRDPAKPENPDEPMLVTPFDHNGKNPATLEETLATHPGELSTKALLGRFMHEFAPARRIFPDGKPRFDEQGRVEMPAWLASEFIRHRTLVDTEDHWKAEMREQYGVFTLGEMEQFAKELGFEGVEVRTSWNPDNHASGYDREMVVTDRNGEPVEQSERFPTQILAVLSKKSHQDQLADMWAKDRSLDASPPSDGRDEFLRDLLDTVGFSGPPALVSKQELDASGQPILYRGVSSPEHAEEFRHGDLYPGTGSSGNGIYCTDRESFAKHKATEGGEVIRVALRPDARIADEYQIDEGMHRDREALRAKTEQKIAALEGPDREEQARELREQAERRELLLFTDPGRYAAYRGYDAIALEQRGFLVLNRSALLVQERE